MEACYQRLGAGETEQDILRACRAEQDRKRLRLLGMGMETPDLLRVATAQALEAAHLYSQAGEVRAGGVAARDTRGPRERADPRGGSSSRGADEEVRMRPERVIYRRRYLGPSPENLTVGIITDGRHYESLSLPRPTPFVVVVERSWGPATLCTLDGLRFKTEVPWRIAAASEVPTDIQEAFDQMVDASLDRLEAAEAEQRVAAMWQGHGKFDARAALHCSQAFRDALLAAVLAEIQRRGLLFPMPTPRRHR